MKEIELEAGPNQFKAELCFELLESL